MTIIGPVSTINYQKLAYPHQHGIHPVELEWGAADAKKRGPIVASRHAGSIKKR